MSDYPFELRDTSIDRVRIEIGAGVVEIAPIDGEETHAFLEVLRGSPEDGVEEITFRVVSGELVVDTPKHLLRHSVEVRVRIETPRALGARIKTGAGDIVATTPLSESRLDTGSGDIRLDDVEGTLTASTGSGDIRVNHTAGAARMKTGSGEVEVSRADGLVAASTGSGDVRIGDAAGPTTIKVGSGDISIERVLGHSVATSGSGDVRVDRAEGPSVRAETARGDVQVGVPTGTPTYLDLKTVTGSIRCDLEPGQQPAEGEPSLLLRARTVSGDITVVRT
ncbi:DUF4097 family beta strand repeat-containing protein [Kribbella deserti]|uniref:DUF4097 domain-containing protein n=1 Tax=Kribbella deserti TaxID=1926257 RepID=A0ABV6QJM5_9ACTN